MKWTIQTLAVAGLFLPLASIRPLYLGLAVLAAAVVAWLGKGGRRSHRCPSCGSSLDAREIDEEKQAVMAELRHEAEPRRGAREPRFSLPLFALLLSTVSSGENCNIRARPPYLCAHSAASQTNMFLSLPRYLPGEDLGRMGPIQRHLLL